MSSCEKCWSDAHSGGLYADVAAQYGQLIEERKDNPCTPEEQAGPHAGKCSRCERMTVHQYTGECMASTCAGSEKGA